MFKLSLAITAGLAGASAPVLADYCAALNTQCGSVFGIPVAACVQGFANIPIGDTTDSNVNSIGCRTKFLNASAFNTTESCRYAGPTGGGRCGSVLESTCNVATTICSNQTYNVSSYANTSDCMLGLASYAALWGSRQGSASSPSDSLECRVYHALVSYSDPTGGHCTHFGTTGSPCTGAILPDVGHYCDTLNDACPLGGDLAQFGSREQCIAIAKGYNNTNADARPSNSENSLGCRQYHAQAAALLTKNHCGHAGPTGGGACGGQLQAWGSILAASPCADSSVNMVIGSVSPVLINAAIPAGYSTSSNDSIPAYSYNGAPGPNTQACRIYHLSVATGDISHCAHGNLGGGEQCGAKIEENLCTAISAICGFGPNSTYQFSSETVCRADLKAAVNGTIGTSKPQSVDGNSYACRFYHVGVAASYLVGGANANAANAQEEMRAHCGHVLKAPLAGCSAVTTSKAPTPKSTTNTTTTPSGAPAFSLLASGSAIFVAVFLL